MKKYEVNIEGMSCAACKAAIERTLAKQAGVSDVLVNLPFKKGLVWFDENLIDEKTINQQIEKIGYQVVEDTTVVNEKKQLSNKKYQLISAIVLMIALLSITMIPMLFNVHVFNLKHDDTLMLIMQTVISLSIMILGKDFYKKGFKGLLHLQPNMDTLVALGTGSAFIYSLILSLLFLFKMKAPLDHLYFESAGVIVTLVLLGKYLEEGSNKKTVASFNALMELTPETAWLKNQKELIKKPVELINPDEIIIVKAGEKIALDGKIIKGSTTVDQSLLSGESLPLEKQENDEVYAGSINLSGVIEVKVSKDYQNSTIAQMIDLVKQAQMAKAPIAKIADTVAAYFVPIICILAIVSAICWWFIKQDFGFALMIMVGVLVIACPCALGLATPTAIVVASGTAAKQGILFKSGEALEKAANIDTVVFDKTGTVTTGILKIATIFSDMEKARVLQYAASLERYSNHPFAKAIEEANNLPFLEIENLQEIAGKGVSAKLDGKKILLGNTSLLKQYKVNISDKEISSEATVYLAIDGSKVATITFTDSIKEESEALIKRLKNQGLKLYLLSGDKEAVTKKMALLLDIDYFAEVLPGGKAQIIQELQKEKRKVAFVGDGINDAVALTAADLGVAIGSGSDIALKSGDVILVNSRLSDVENTLKIGRKTLANIKQNLFWAFFYNCLGIPLAMGIFYSCGWYINPMFGALAMSLSSLFVVSNAQRLRRL